MVEIFRKRNYLCVRIFLSKTLVKRCFLAGNKGQSQMHAHYRGHFMTLQNSSGSLHRTFCVQFFITSYLDLVRCLVGIHTEFHIQIQKGFGPIGLL